MLEVCNVVKKYSKKYALDNVSFCLPSNGLVFITGESGCGKSTLLSLISGILRCTSGYIKYNGYDISKYTNREKANYLKNEVAFIYQKHNLMSEYTVYENIITANSKITNDEIDNILESLNILDLKNKEIKKISVGEKQRVGIARALAKNSSVLLCDEPTGSLDGPNASAFFSILKEISKEKLVIVVTHSLKYVEEFGDIVFKLERGKIIDHKIINQLDKRETDDINYVNNNINNETNILKIQPKLSFKSLLYNISFQKVKYLIFTILIACVFAATGMFAAYCTVDTAKAFYNYKHNNDGLIIVTDNKENMENVGKDIYSTFEESNIIIGKVYISTPFGSEMRKAGWWNFDVCCYAVTEDYVEADDLNIAYGLFPEKTNEYLITEYAYCFLKNYGAELENGQRLESNHITPDSLIGTKLANNVIISGIVDTGYLNNVISTNYTNEIRRLVEENKNLGFSYYNINTIPKAELENKLHTNSIIIPRALSKNEYIKVFNLILDNNYAIDDNSYTSIKSAIAMNCGDYFAVPVFYSTIVLAFLLLLYSYIVDFQKNKYSIAIFKTLGYSNNQIIKHYSSLLIFNIITTLIISLILAPIFIQSFQPIHNINYLVVEYNLISFIIQIFSIIFLNAFMYFLLMILNVHNDTSRSLKEV